jgi:hypothetical protein
VGLRLISAQVERGVPLKTESPGVSWTRQGQPSTKGGVLDDRRVPRLQYAD